MHNYKLQQLRVQLRKNLNFTYRYKKINNATFNFLSSK